MSGDLKNDQPEISWVPCKDVLEHSTNLDRPYTSESLTLKFGKGLHRYTVPRQIFERLPTASMVLKRRANGGNITLPRADEDIGHTMVHWLYTGEYQTIQNPSLQGKMKRENEYRLAVHTYCAALNYAFPGLELHARRQMEMQENAVDTGRILAIAGEVFPKYEGINVPAGYQDYLRDKMASAVKSKEQIFQRHELVKALGKVPEFDMFVLENTMLLFLLQMSDLEESLDTALKQRSHKDEAVGENGCSKGSTEPQGPPPYSDSVTESDCERLPTNIESKLGFGDVGRD